ncbi:MAG: hypothetical protein JO115_23355 [Pseudonocardiales bacterium]|nr:hypothetical protein [Pseudonocardiales bacterium]
MNTRSAPANPRLNSLVEQRFPLLPRSKPVCRSLTDRIDRVRRQADLASQHTDDSLLRAAEAHNLAALIASDCGMPALARDLCWRQFDIFATSGPYDQASAKLALQPLVNLGRLRTRDGNGTAAYQIHEALFQAAKTRTEASVDGRTISLGNIVHRGDDHREIVRWLWTILLADGIRALCRAGRWSEALHQAEQYNGLGQRLFDGRQVAIIAHCAAHNHAEALRLTEASATPTAWEEAVAACMKVICLTWAGQPTSSATAAMLDTYLALDPVREHAVFHVRLGLSVADLAHNTHDTQPVVRMIERSALDAADAYAAHDIRANRTPSPLTKRAAQALNKIVRAAGLGTTMRPRPLDNLMQSVQRSETALTRALATGVV